MISHANSCRSSVACLVIVTALLLPLGLQAQRPTRLSRMSASPYDGYAVPAGIIGGSASEYLGEEAGRLADTPAARRHEGNVDALVTAAVAVTINENMDAADWGRRLYGTGTPAAAGYEILVDILSGRVDRLMELPVVLADQNLTAGWRDLATGVKAAAETEGGASLSPRGWLGLYMIGLPYPGKHSVREAGAYAALKSMFTIPAEDRRAVAGVVLAAKSSPELKGYYRRLEAMLTSAFRNRQRVCPELGGLLVGLADDPRKKRHYAAILPHSMKALKDEAATDAMRQAAAADDVPPEKTFSLARGLIRKGQVKEGLGMLFTVEEKLSPERRPPCWQAIFATLISADKRGIDVGTSLDTERQRRIDAAEQTPSAHATLALADFKELVDRNDTDPPKSYAAVTADPRAPHVLRFYAWMKLTSHDTATAWNLFPHIHQDAVRQPYYDRQNLDRRLLLTGIIEGHLAETADIVAELRPHRRGKHWWLGYEAALRCLAGQKEQTRDLLAVMDDPEVEANGFDGFLRLTGTPRQSVGPRCPGLSERATQALNALPPTPWAWPAAARRALELLPESATHTKGQKLWQVLVAHVPGDLPEKDAHLPSALGKTLVDSCKAHDTRPSSSLPSLPRLAVWVLQPLNNPHAIPVATDFLQYSLEAAAEAGMKESDANYVLTQFIQALARAKTADANLAGLRETVRQVYPDLVDVIPSPER